MLFPKSHHSYDYDSDYISRHLPKLLTFVRFCSCHLGIFAITTLREILQPLTLTLLRFAVKLTSSKIQQISLLH